MKAPQDITVKEVLIKYAKALHSNKISTETIKTIKFCFHIVYVLQVAYSIQELLLRYVTIVGLFLQYKE